MGQFNDVTLKDESQTHILTPVDNLTLKLDISYAVQMYFSNLDGKFNITAFASSSKLPLGCNYVSILPSVL